MLFSRFFSFLTSRFPAFVLLLAWMTVIFSFSMLSGKLTAGPPPLWYFIERKGAHVIEYAMLMMLSFRYFRLAFSRESFGWVLALSAAFSLMYGVTDELHQFFVPLRGARMWDVGIDGIGILLAGVLIILLQRNKNRP